MRRRSFLLLPAGIPALAALQKGASLRRAVVLLYTTDEDKDWDTNVSIRIGRGRETVARKENIQGLFNNYSTQSIDLEVAPFPVEREELERSGTLTIQISPNGHDTWRFDATVRLDFGGPTLERSHRGITLDQDRREYRTSL